MKTISRYIMTLALLLTAVTGAWAEGKVINSEIDFESLKVGDILTEGFSISGPKSVMFYFNAGRAKKGETLLNEDVSFYRYRISSVGTNTVITLSADAGDAAGTYTPIDENGQVANAWIVTSMNGSGNSDFHLSGYKYVAPAADPDVEVTTNAASEGATFTEASFQMPAFDATADYELVRDMSVQMPVTVGDGKDGYRIRVKKNTQKQFEPADMDFQAMLALYTVTDQIEQKTLAFMGQNAVCALSIYAVDDKGDPTGDPIAFEALTPGRYVAIATAKEGTDYDGTTLASNIFELYQGYEVTIPAGEFITYFKDENLKVEDAAAELYTIKSVTATEAVLSSKLESVPAGVPMLVYNNSQEEKTFVLIPTDEIPVSLMWYSGFKGTLEDKTFTAADLAANDCYVCTGKTFAVVSAPGTLAANRCWLQIKKTPGARKRTIVFGGDNDGTTGIDRLDADAADGDFYDLSGRKIDKPAKKGIYILNGKKVIIK